MPSKPRGALDRVLDTGLGRSTVPHGSEKGLDGGSERSPEDFEQLRYPCVRAPYDDLGAGGGDLPECDGPAGSDHFDPDVIPAWREAAPLVSAIALSLNQSTLVQVSMSPTVRSAWCTSAAPVALTAVISDPLTKRTMS